MDRAALAVRLTWAHRRKAGVNRLQHLLIVGSDGGRFFEAPHAAVGAGVLLDVAQFGAGQFDVLSLREAVFGGLQQYLQRAAVIVRVLAVCESTDQLDGRPGNRTLGDTSL